MTASRTSEEAVAEALLRRGAVFTSDTEPFEFASGLLSPIYVDSRRLISYPDDRERVVEAFLGEARRFPPSTAVAGVATGGIPWAAWVSGALHQPLTYVRGEAKGRGLRRQVEGRLDPGAEVLVIEDLVTTGSSSATAVKALRAEGANVVGVLSIFTYEVPYAERLFARLGCPQVALCGISSLVSLGTDYLDAATIERVQRWRDEALPAFQPR